jgi:hypothetical protein
MILDRSMSFDGPGFVAITTSRDSTDILDLGMNRDASIGTDVSVLILSNRTFAGGTSVAIALQGAPDNGSGGEGTYVTYVASPAITLAQLNAAPGMVLPVQLPRPPYGGLSMPRFLKLVYTVVGTFTAGGLAASLLLNRDDVVNYPGAVSMAGV